MSRAKEYKVHEKKDELMQDHDKKQVREDRLIRELKEIVGENILIVTESDQLNLFGQTFRPIFTGTLFDVQQGHITLYPVIIKIINAPFFEFPTPLSIPLEKIAHFTPDFDPNTRFPLT
ncbi:hypothetical protein ACFSCX_02520 [Bacillus salitolerans]|uniref:Uncharacterized protein n=1 Tax=Bacillus salitolerans TaxID=1437434 RepID=A0ABW4LJZ6_9BACI